MREFGKNILLFLGVSCITLLCIEGVLRLFEAEDFSLPIRINDDGYVMHKPSLDKKRFDNESKKKVSIRTNSLGFVGEEWKKEKSPGVLRIAVFGDSFTEAMQVDYPKGYVSLLPNALANATSSPLFANIEVLNVGFGGTGTADAMLMYEKYVREYSPDIVVLSLYSGNDFYDNSVYLGDRNSLLGPINGWKAVLPPSAIEQAGFLGLKAKIFRGSAIVRLVDKVVRGTPAFHALAVKVGIFRAPVTSSFDYPLFYNYYVQPLSPEVERAVGYTSELVRSFQEAVKNDGSQFLMMVIPEALTITSSSIQIVLDEYPTLREKEYVPQRTEEIFASRVEGVPALFLRKVIFEETEKTGQSLYLDGRGHLTERGHEVVVEQLSRFILSQYGR